MALDASGETPTTAAAPVQVEADVNLVLDDGSQENAASARSISEFMVLNRFTPGAGDFAFDLDEIRVYFESGSSTYR